MKRDVEAAKKLLAEAGHPDGIEVELHCKKDPDWEPSACQAMVEQWAEAGIKVKLNVMPGAQYWDVWTKVPFGFTTWTHRPLAIMVLGLAYRTGVPWNESDYANPKFDELLTKAEGIVDLEERKKVVKELELIMQEDGTDRPAAVARQLPALHRQAEGLSSAPDGVLLLRGRVAGSVSFTPSAICANGGPARAAVFVFSCSIASAGLSI